MKDVKIRRANNARRINQSTRCTREEKLELKNSELKSLEKMIENMKIEQKNLKKRLEVVGNPSYSLMLRKQIIDIKDQIHVLEEHERKAVNDKFLRDKEIDRVLMAGQSDAMIETQDKAKELTVLMDQWQKLHKKIAAKEKTQEEAEK